MSCEQCGSSHRNSVHKRRTQFGYHEFVSPEPKPYTPTLEERIETLERRVDELEAQLAEERCRQ